MIKTPSVSADVIQQSCCSDWEKLYVSFAKDCPEKLRYNERSVIVPTDSSSVTDCVGVVKVFFRDKRFQSRYVNVIHDSQVCHC